MAEEHETVKSMNQVFHRLYQIPPGANGEKGRPHHMDSIKEGKKHPARICYGNQTCVWVREIKDPSKAFFFRGHLGTVRAARFHPNAGAHANWVASGDDRGSFRVWTAREREPVTKNEAEFGRCVRDISWGSEAKKIVVAGEGKEETLKEYSWDTANSFTKTRDGSGSTNCVDASPNRVFRIYAGGNNGSLTYFQSGEMVWSDKKYHAKVWNCMRYHPSGNYILASMNPQNKKSSPSLVLVDGRAQKKQEKEPWCGPRDLLKVIETKGSIKSGNILSIAWSPCGTMFAATGTTKSVLIYSFKVDKSNPGQPEIEKLHCVELGKTNDFQQTAVMWAVDDVIVSSSMLGVFNFISPQGEVIQSIAGHQSGIIDMATEYGKGLGGNIIAIDMNRVLVHNVANRTSRLIYGQHGTDRFAIIPLRFCDLNADGTMIVTVANDNTMIRTPIDADVLDENRLSTGGRCRWVLCGKKNPSLTVVFGKEKGIQIYLDDKLSSECKPSFDSTAAALYNNDTRLLVAEEKDRGDDCCYITEYEILPSGFLKQEPLTRYEVDGTREAINAMKVSPSEKFIAIRHSRQQFLDIFDLNALESGPQSVKPASKMGQSALRDFDWNREDEKQMVQAGTSTQVACLQDVVQNPSLCQLGNHRNLRHHNNDVRCCAWLTKTEFVTAGEDGALHVYSTEQPEEESS